MKFKLLENVNSDNLIYDLEDLAIEDYCPGEVTIVDEGDWGKEIVVDWIDDADNWLAHLLLTIYDENYGDEDDRHGICFRELWIKDDLQGEGYGQDIVTTCLRNIEKNDIVLVHLDTSDGFWSHMKHKFPTYNWDPTVK